MSINIKTTLGICPRTRLNEKITIQRGASAEINYSLLDKGVAASLLEQITFTFKQKRHVFWYNMFRYLVPTADTEIEDDKVYYRNVRIISDNGLECTADVVFNPVDDPSSAGYYEEVLSLKDHQNDFCYFIDNHFSLCSSINGEYIKFTLSPEETAILSPTVKGADVQFEVALRLNTDANEEFANHDSIIIDKQPSIIVKDSLYSQTEAAVVSINPENTASTRKIVRR